MIYKDCGWGKVDYTPYFYKETDMTLPSNDVLIVGKTLGEAITFLNNIASSLSLTDIDFYDRNSGRLHTVDGTRYHAFAPESMCGTRCCKAYIQKGVSTDYVDYVIRPAFVGDLDYYNIEYFD